MSAHESDLDPTSPGGVLRQIRHDLGLSNKHAFGSARATVSRLEVRNSLPAFDTVLCIYEAADLASFAAYLDAHVRYRDAGRPPPPPTYAVGTGTCAGCADAAGNDHRHAPRNGDDAA